MNDEFYLQDSRSDVGTNTMFWCKGGCGYATNLDYLETYTLEEAQNQHNRRNTDVPLLKSLVDKLSITAVDMQVLPEKELSDLKGQYIIQENEKYNGNDISLVCEFGKTFNYDEAHIFSYNKARYFLRKNINHTMYSKQSLDKVARRTFQVENINRKTMIYKPGIKFVKPKRIRPTTGKTRGNCPECERLTWDFNPYENAYCKDHEY